MIREEVKNQLLSLKSVCTVDDHHMYMYITISFEINSLIKHLIFFTGGSKALIQELFS